MTRPSTAFACLLLLVACDGESTDVDAAVAADDAGSLDGGAADSGMADSGSPDAGAMTATDTWASWAQGFFTTYCTECHAGGRRDYTTITEVRRDLEGISCGVSTIVEEGCGSFPPPRQFPVGDGPFPSDEERTRLIDWINAGLPE